ncbi:hypothetical protein PQX77_011496 [Marasmius sp. AFHP31]|nr:hypothetical protein PQX77_011496 [Marasmius sp. AFHP31]
MNTRRTPPHSKPTSHQVAQPPHSTTSPSLTQKPAASSSVQGTRRSPVESPGSQPAQSLPSIRDHLHPYLPPAPPDSGSSGLVALPSSATPAFSGGYPFQPYGSAPGPSHLPQPPHPSQSGSGYYSHQPPPPLGYARAAPPHHLPSKVDDSEDDEPMAGPSSRRRRTFSGGRVSEGMKESREVYDRERGEDHGGSGSGMDLDTEGPPKKKRRRQALSCTGASICLFFCIASAEWLEIVKISANLATHPSSQNANSPRIYLSSHHRIRSLIVVSHGSEADTNSPFLYLSLHRLPFV